MPKDIFTSRLLKLKDESYFTRGFCLIPRDLKDKIVFEVNKRV